MPAHRLDSIRIEPEDLQPTSQWSHLWDWVFKYLARCSCRRRNDNHLLDYGIVSSMSCCRIRWSFACAGFVPHKGEDHVRGGVKRSDAFALWHQVLRRHDLRFLELTRG